jgi:four helix bundle protein
LHRVAMPNPTILPFTEWVATVSEAITGDPLWAMQAYRLAMYAIDCHSADRRVSANLMRASALDQATRAIGSVAANIAEGYSRSSLADRNRFYGYALGSTREAISWYDTLRVELGELSTERQSTLIQVRRLLLTTLKRTRSESALNQFSATKRKPPRKKL